MPPIVQSWKTYTKPKSQEPEQGTQLASDMTRVDAL